MGNLTLRASGPADPDVVWEGYADPQVWPTWSPHIARVEAVGRLRPGLSGRVWTYVPPPVSFDVLAVDARSRTWAWKVRLGPLTLVLEHAVVPEPSGTATSLTLHGPWPVLVAYAPVAKLALHRLVRLS